MAEAASATAVGSKEGTVRSRRLKLIGQMDLPAVAAGIQDSGAGRRIPGEPHRYPTTPATTTTGWFRSFSTPRPSPTGATRPGFSVSATKKPEAQNWGWFSTPHTASKKVELEARNKAGKIFSVIRRTMDVQRPGRASVRGSVAVLDI